MSTIRNIFIQSPSGEYSYPSLGWQLNVINTGYIEIHTIPIPHVRIHILFPKFDNKTGWVTADVCIQKDGKMGKMETWKWPRPNWCDPSLLTMETVNSYVWKAGV